MTDPTPPRRLPASWLPLGLLLLGLGVYANSLGGGHFLLDDEPSIEANPDIQTILPLWRDGGRTANPAVNSRPAVRLSLAANYALGGLEVGGYRAFNLGVHLLCGLLLYAVARRALAERPAAAELAFAIALLWTVHPLQTQCVNQTIQRSTSLMALFYLSTLYCVQRGAAARSALWYGGGVLACALGMASKEAMVTAPVAVALYDRTFLAGSLRRALAQRWGLYLGLAATWGLLALLLRANAHSTTIVLDDPAVVWHYAANQTRIVVEHYIAKALWPAPLTNFYGPLRYDSWRDIAPFAPVLAALLAATLYALKRHPAAGFAGGSFFLLLAPTSSFAAIHWEAMAERRPYLALAGLLALAVTGAHALLARWTRSGRLTRAQAGRLGWGALAVAALLCGAATSARNADYRDPVRLWRAEVAYLADTIGRAEDPPPKVAYHHAGAHVFLGRALADAGRGPEARDSYQRALAIYPAYSGAHKWLGIHHGNRGESDQALLHFRRAVELNPGDFSTHNMLGTLLCMRGQVDEGVAHIRRALDIRPNYVWAHHSLGTALELQGRPAAARAQFLAALRLAPDFAPARENLAALEARIPSLSNP